MAKRIEEILSQIKTLENELVDELKAKEKEFLYTIEDKKVKFEEEVIKEGRSKIVSSIKYISSFSIPAMLVLPFIWSMIIPAIILDISATVYQTIYFPVYKIPKVKRSDYLIMDRYNLFYLDRFEKINCWYCEYFNGVIAYVREMAARTEQFWCPIKHAQALKEKHSRYETFFDFGDYIRYREELETRRSDFTDLKEKTKA